MGLAVSETSRSSMSHVATDGIGYCGVRLLVGFVAGKTFGWYWDGCDSVAEFVSSVLFLDLIRMRVDCPLPAYAVSFVKCHVID